MTKALTPRREKIYTFICDFVQEYGYPPTVREIAQEVNLSSTSSVAVHLNKLEKDGYIKRDPKKPRAIELLIKLDNEPIDDDVRSELSDEQERILNSVDLLPLLGEVAAGTPILAVENVEDYIAVPKEITNSRGDFILRVRGDSMINAGINDGDLVIVKQQSTAYNTEIVVALIEDSATVKTFYKEDNCVRLQPENDNMDPIYVRNPLILGKVVGLLRYF